MRDRELLELAAKAAGYARMVWRDDVPYVSSQMNGDDFEAWSPLADDGDALRLAVKLRIECGYATLDGKHEFATVSHPDVDGELWEPIEGDEASAARRAIVRAAAAIGAAQQE